MYMDISPLWTTAVASVVLHGLMYSSACNVTSLMRLAANLSPRRGCFR